MHTAHIGRWIHIATYISGRPFNTGRVSQDGKIVTYSRLYLESSKFKLINEIECIHYMVIPFFQNKQITQKN